MMGSPWNHFRKCCSKSDHTLFPPRLTRNRPRRANAGPARSRNLTSPQHVCLPTPQVLPTAPRALWRTSRYDQAVSQVTVRAREALHVFKEFSTRFPPLVNTTPPRPSVSFAHPSVSEFYNHATQAKLSRPSGWEGSAAPWAARTPRPQRMRYVLFKH